MSHSWTLTFYRTPGRCHRCIAEQLAYVAACDPARQLNDSIAVIT
jgi:hypothetical protein